MPPWRSAPEREKDVNKFVVRRLSTVLALLVLVAGSVAYGYLCEARGLPGYVALRRVHMWASAQPVLAKAYSLATGRQHGSGGTGAWNNDRHHRSSRTDESLQTIPYLSGYKKAPTADHVTVYVEERAGHGLNLYTSGHAPETVLMDMRGNVLHRWSYDFTDAFPGRPIPSGPKSWGWWSRVHLQPNGDIVVIYDGYGLAKVDKDSRLIWATPGEFHHDLFVDEHEMIYCLTRATTVLPRIHPFEPVVEDFITIVDQEGNLARNVSILEAFENSDYVPLLDNMMDFGDVLHTNTIEVFDGSLTGRSPIFKKGNVLISCALIDVVAIIDMETERVVWALTGQWDRQHNPTLLANGHILLLDHLWRHNLSRDIAIDPFTQVIVWEYDGTPENGFFTKTFGTNQRLPGGNTLINESDRGRAFEVTPENEIVWEFYNPAHTGESGELIATLFDFQRLDTDAVAEWLPDPGP